jgi:hypothetical protein
MDIRSDIQSFIDYAVDFAEKMLNDSGEFYPFAARIDINGELTGVGYEDNETDFPKSNKVIKKLTKILGSQLNNKEIKAYVLAYDVKVQTENSIDKSDAILIDIYHQEPNEIPKYYFTYFWNDNKELTFGESFGVNK